VPLGMTGHPRHSAKTELEKEPRLSLGMLPLARRDVERFRQILGLQRRLLDPRLSPRARRALMHRGPFREALAWLEVHGEAPEAVEHWRGFIEASGVAERNHDGGEDLPPTRRRRRRRRRSFRPATN
jgi:Polymerase A arginine-rich C-terminus